MNTRTASSTKPTSRVDQLHLGIPDRERGTYAGIAHPAIIEHLKSLGVTCNRAHAGAPLRQRLGLDRRGLSITGDTTPSRSSHRTRNNSSSDPGGQVREFNDGARAPRSPHRSHHRRRLQPTAEGKPPGSYTVVAGIENSATTDWSMTTSASTWTTPAPGSAHVGHPRPAATDGFAALLGDRDAWTAFLRSRVNARPQFCGRRQTRHILRTRSRIRWSAGQTHRRALGCRARRATKGRFPPQWTDGTGSTATVRDFWRGDDATLGEFAPPHRLRGSL